MADSCPTPRRMVCKLEKAKRLPAVGPINHPCKAAILARALIGDLANEHLLVVYMTHGLCPIAYDLITTGARSHVVVSPGDLLRSVIAAGANAFVTAHNHPSGNPAPSEADERLFRELAQRAQVLEIQHLDDLVIGVDAFWSRNARGSQDFASCGHGSDLQGYGGGVRRGKRR